MKKKLFILIFILACSMHLNAQRQIRIGYVDMDYILKQVPEYQEANQELDNKIQEWKGEIELKNKEIKTLKTDLENERPLLTHDLIEEREDEIDYLEQKLQEYQQKRFGPEGDMIARERQIIQPLQDEIFNAVQEIGKKREYDFIFDSSAEALMLFSANRHDISDQVLANITRNTKRHSRDKDKENPEKGEPIYKSVRQARLDKEENEKRESEKQAKIDERQNEIEKRQQQRDSIMAARQAKRDKIIADRQAERDSIDNIRKGNATNINSPSANTEQSTDNKKTENKTDSGKAKRDSIRKARQKQQEDLIKTREKRRDSIMAARKAKHEKLLNERQKERDSIDAAKQKAREERNK